MYNTRTGVEIMSHEISRESLEQRVARLEQALRAGRISHGLGALSQKRFLWSFLIAATAAFLCFRGLGLPNHPYQGALGGLTIALAYHRRWLLWPRRWYEWCIAPLNGFLVAALFKLIIGSGVRHPLYWLNYPVLKFEREAGKWVEVLPDLKILWQPMPIAGWEIDLTLIQTFLAVVTLIGALFRFQPFASFTAFLLILVSLPALSSFNWPWVFPAMAVAAIALYLQSQTGTEAPSV